MTIRGESTRRVVPLIGASFAMFLWPKGVQEARQAAQERGILYLSLTLTEFHVVLSSMHTVRHARFSADGDRF